MSGGYTYTPGILLSVFTVLMWLALAVYGWRRRDEPGARPFAIGALFGAAWSAAAVMEYAAVDFTTKVFWFKVQANWQLPAIPAATCFVLEYAWPGRWLTRRNLALLSIAPVLFVAMTLTSHRHHLAWRGFAYDGLVIPQRGSLTWALVAYGYGLGILNLIVLVWLFTRSPRHRWPVVLIVTGQVGSRVLYAVGATRVVQSPVRLDLAALTVISVTYAIALFGFRIFDPVGMARQAVMAQMRDGVLVLDARGRVVSLNPAAQDILGQSGKQALGRPVEDLLPSYPEVGVAPDSSDAAEAEISLGKGPEARYYRLEMSSLKDWRELLVGRLVLLHDVTERRRVQAEALQQKWAEATLQERELLAQELHDGVAQNLGFLNLQAQAAQVHLRGGQPAAAQDVLDRLAQVALELQGETRELIGNLLAFTLPTESLCSAIRQAAAHFGEQNGLPVTLDIADGVEAVCSHEALPPAAGVQLLRITQEALANVRKHAGSPGQIGVTLGTDDGCLRLVITDNGAGFDPRVVDSDGGRFGLQVMRRRAARIGGELRVRSAPGQGTSVEVSVPLGAGPPGDAAA